ncbi:MAG TPA: zinc-dependent metalloprotease [Sporichthyaceae bacterium]
MGISGGAAMVDWKLAAATAKRLMPSPPAMPPAEVHAVVEELRRYAAESRRHVAEFTGLQAPDDGSPVRVVDRQGWVEVNIDGFRAMSEPLLDKLAATRTPGLGVISAVGRRATGMELGGLLAYLGTKILGQYEAFLPSVGAPGYGTLLLVAPNIVSVEQQLKVDAADFRRWVCLHEETHRVQFTAVPWLREHLAGEIRELIGSADLDAGELFHRMTDVLRGIADAARGKPGVDLVSLILRSAEQRATMDRLTAVMSLLEGHADHVMDGVGPTVVPTVVEIRKAFQTRRASAGSLDQFLRRILGMEAKMRQYRDGKKFVDVVVEQVGMAGFNRVWESPQTLPTLDEVHAPADWVSRVHGAPAAVSAGTHGGE